MPTRNAINSVAACWLKSKNEAVRLAAAGSILRAKAHTFLPELIGMLDDPFLINRQFTQRGLQEMQNVRLEKFCYRFFMSPHERRDALNEIRHAFLK